MIPAWLVALWTDAHDLVRRCGHSPEVQLTLTVHGALLRAWCERCQWVAIRDYPSPGAGET